MQFLTAGDEKYFIYMRENCVQVRRHYPQNKIYIYDFGLTAEQISDLETSFQPVEVIDWKDKIDDYKELWASTSEDQKRKLALALNARQTGWRKRLKKAFFKRFPNSGFAEKMKAQALRFENLLVQKIKCMRDASDRAGDERLVFLDADALMFQPIDDAFDDETDVTLTVLSKITWDHNACFVYNSGVIFFGPDARLRNRFIDSWWEETKTNQEWLREQTSLVRLVEKSVARDAVIPGTRAVMTAGGASFRLRFEACDEFNFFDMENREVETFPDARIFHFTGRRQQPDVFRSLVSSLRQKYAQ